jgi:hypothetical protein
MDDLQTVYQRMLQRKQQHQLQPSATVNQKPNSANSAPVSAPIRPVQSTLPTANNPQKTIQPPFAGQFGSRTALAPVTANSKPSFSRLLQPTQASIQRQSAVRVPPPTGSMNS